MPAPLSFVDLEGILTGMRMLACVSLLRVNRKAGTKPMCASSWIQLPKTMMQLFQPQEGQLLTGFETDIMNSFPYELRIHTYWCILRASFLEEKSSRDFLP